MDRSRRSPSREAQPRARRQTCHRAELPERLRAGLAERGLSQAKLSQQTSIDPSLLSKILNGKRRPNAAQLGALAHVLGIELGELLVLANEPAELDQLRAERDQANRRANEAEAARARAESAISKRISELEARLEDAARARQSVEAELRGVEQELAAAKLRLGVFELGGERDRPRAAKHTADPSRGRPGVSYSTVELVDAAPLDERHARRKRDVIESVGVAIAKCTSTLYFCYTLARSR